MKLMRETILNFNYISDFCYCKIKKIKNLPEIVPMIQR